MSVFDSSPATPLVLPADQPLLDEAQLAAVAFLARYGGGTLDSYRADLRQFFQWADDVASRIVTCNMTTWFVADLQSPSSNASATIESV